MVRKYSRKGGKRFRQINLKKGGTKRKFQRGGMWRNKQCSPLIGAPWNPLNSGNHFSSGTPIGVGGLSPYFGNNSPSPQMSYSTAATLSQRGGKYKKNRSRKSCSGGSKRRSKHRRHSRHSKKLRRRNRKMRGGAISGQSDKDSLQDSAAANHQDPIHTKCVNVGDLKPPNPDTILPQPLVNAYRVAKNSLFNAYNTYNGLQLQASPLPHIQNSMQY